MHRLHGILSMVLIIIAVLTALVHLFFTSAIIGCIYLVLGIAASLTILYAYCAKCAAREHHCSHLFPGKLTRWLPGRTPEPYRSIDLLATVGSLALIFLFPQYWLWQNKAILLVFWAVTIMALADIFLRVCRDCRNHNCMLSKNRG